MERKYFLIVLMVACSQEITQAHILPFSYNEFPMQECVRALTRSVNNLCSVYGEYVSGFENSMQLVPRQMTHDNWDTRAKVLKLCCQKPCTVSELIAIC